MNAYLPGQIIRFTYNHRNLDEDTGDRHKEILVLNPNWRGQLHGIDMKRLTAAEREVLQAIFEPKWKKQMHRLSLVRDILRRMDPPEEAKNPMAFYYRFVKVFLKHKDAYRRYYVGRMINVTTVQVSYSRGAAFNPKPLFKKIGSPEGKAATKKATDKQNEMTPLQKAQRAAAVKKVAKKMFGDKGAKLTQTPAQRIQPTIRKAQSAKKAAPPMKAAPSTKSTPAKKSTGTITKNHADRLAMIRTAAAKMKAKKK